MAELIPGSSSCKEYKLRKLARWGSISRIIEKIGSRQKVLDVGCSEGYLARLLPSNDVWGVDINPRAARAAARHCRDVAVADLNFLDDDRRLFDESFDVIVFADVLEHLVRPQWALEYFGRMLSAGGRIIVSLPNVALWRVRLNLLLGRFDYGEYGVLDDTHLHLYTFKTARKLIEDSGYRVVGVEGAANLLGAVVMYLPFLKKLFSINIVIVAVKRT